VIHPNRFHPSAQAYGLQVRKQHGNARSGLVCKVKEKILELYELERWKHDQQELSKSVTKLLRDDRFLFDVEDREVFPSIELRF
jgi:hypothetical protein